MESKSVTDDNLIIEIPCHICGHIDTPEFCSRCGATLTPFSDMQKPVRKELLHQIGDVLRDVIDPFFASIKTFWLVVFLPEQFFGAIFYKNKAIHDVSFPFARYWHTVSPSAYQYILDPIRYVLVSIFLILFFYADNAISSLNQASGIKNVGTLDELSRVAQFEVVVFFVLLFVLFSVVITSSVFYLFIPRKYKSKGQVKNVPITRYQVYVFWTYLWGSVFLFVGMIIFVFSGFPGNENFALFGFLLTLLFVPLFITNMFVRVPSRAFIFLPKHHVVFASFMTVVFFVILIVFLGKFLFVGFFLLTVTFMVSVNMLAKIIFYIILILSVFPVFHLAYSNIRKKFSKSK